jgi:hypothetical protein
LLLSEFVVVSQPDERKNNAGHKKQQVFTTAQKNHTFVNENFAPYLDLRMTASETSL